MRNVSARQRAAAVIPASVAALVPVLALLSRHPHTPVNDALVGGGVGLLIGVSAMSLIMMRRKSRGDGTSLPK